MSCNRGLIIYSIITVITSLFLYLFLDEKGLSVSVIYFTLRWHGLWRPQWTGLGLKLISGPEATMFLTLHIVSFLVILKKNWENFVESCQKLQKVLRKYGRTDLACWSDRDGIGPHASCATDFFFNCYYN